MRYRLRTLLILVAVIPAVGFLVSQIVASRFPSAYTGRALDVTIDGPGYFLLTVDDHDEPTHCTRSGRFWIDNNSQIRVGNPEQELRLYPTISVPLEGQASIDPEGIVYATVRGDPEPISIGAIQLAMFPNPDGLQEVSPGLFCSTEESGYPFRETPGVRGAGICTSGWLELRDIHRQESWPPISTGVFAAFAIGTLTGLALGCFVTMRTINRPA